MASPLPLSSLRLLVPPLRLLTAAMWKAAQCQSVKHYGLLEDFVSMVTVAVPELLTDRQTRLLLLALRAKVTLCDPDTPISPAHLDKIRCVSTVTANSDVDECCTALLNLTAAVSQRPAEAGRLLQEVFDQSFDSALLSLLSDLLSRLELMFPIPDFKQAASWLDAVPAGVDDCLQDTEELCQLLTNSSCSLGQAPPTSGGNSEKALLSVWSHPLISKQTICDPRDTSDVQSDPVHALGGALQLDVELVKVEVVVMTEDKPREREAVIFQTEPVTSNESAALGGDKCSSVVLEDRLKESFDSRTNQSEDTVGQSDHPGSDVTPNALHSISHNSQRVAHKCPRCGKCFIYRSQVIRHLRTNRSCGLPATANRTPQSRPASSSDEDPRPPEGRLPDSRPIKAHSCFQCSGAFKTKAELLSHQRTHRTPPIYRCAQCDKEFHHLSSLTNHKQTHLDKAGFTCRRCHKVFESVEERDAHRAEHLSPDLSCSVCSQAFSSQTQLLRHLQTHSVEGATPGYNCRYCNRSFSGVTQLRIHQRTHTSRSFQCDQCSKWYGSLTGLHSHRASHSADTRFLCPQCGKRFKSRDGLEGHLRTHTGERPHCCPFCPKAFTALAGLNVHVRRHTGERPYVCTVCGKGWPSGGDLQKHMRTHTGERPYVCLDCGKAFSISCHLTEHRRIHTGEKPFSCPECGKCLRRKFDLKKHMLSHSNVRPHACTICPKSYTRKTHLNRHLLTHRTAHCEAAKEEEEEA